ncbi:MAG: phytoene desaturase family protein [Bacillota bacterium]
MKKKINIIGAGIAGLCAGCYGQMNGYDTEIFEMHNIPGGLCTAWERKGYTIDGCIEWLMGTVPNSAFYKLWNEIGALDGGKFIAKDQLTTVEGSEGQKLTLYTDINKTEAEMLRISPEDAPLIHEMAIAVRRITGMSIPVDKPQDMYNFFDIVKLIIKMGPKIGIMNKFNKISVGDYAQKFKSPFLREAICSYIDNEYTMFVFLMILATYNAKDAAWCVGGSLEFAKGIEKKYLELGGKITYKAKVENILIENHKAVGIKLVNGDEHRSDYVISAADGYATIYKMLKGAYVDEKIKSLYENTPTASTSVQVSLGINCDLSDKPHSLIFKPDQPIMVGDNECKLIQINHFGYDKTMCPPGKSVTRGTLYTNYEFWEKIYNDSASYKAEKDRIALEYIRAIEKRYPEVKGKIEMVDVSTPMTYVRYTGTWKGVYMSWLTTPKNPMVNAPSKLPGLGSFYMAGQWANSTGGGIPVGILTGKWCIMRICTEDKKKTV